MTHRAPHRTLCLVAYDIREDTRRARALRAVKAFGLDGQKSVHECALSQSERRELSLRLSGLIDPDTDRIMVLPLDPRSTIVTLGGQTRAPLAPRVLVIA
ncbi:CRISPR-associated endonuclease Cas2 [Puniceibacterium sediminis]|nr:CRISPR-associated endonuclease Cas2 [Puniceibacterium sediminis]